MSAPFGGHPTLGDFLRWATESGCTINYGVYHLPNGKTQSVIKINTPDGKYLHIVGVQNSEHLMPTIIGNFERRLGMKTPFFAIDEDNPQSVNDKSFYVAAETDFKLFKDDD